jgi:hypothetical protein
MSVFAAKLCTIFKVSNCLLTALKRISIVGFLRGKQATKRIRVREKSTIHIVGRLFYVNTADLIA